MEASGPRIAVFIDWQNAYKTAREAFGMLDMPNEHGNFSPYQLSRILAAGHGRAGGQGQLARVVIHRGLPSQQRDPKGYAANRRQAAAWTKEGPKDLVVPMFRLLRYPYNYPAEPAVEKGVDVQLALGAVEWALDDESNIAIVLSHDNDLLPVPEAIDRLADASRVETASWVSPTYRQRLRPKGGVYHHEILKAVFDRVATPVNYARSSQS